MLRRILACIAIALMAPIHFGAFLYNWAYRAAPGKFAAEAEIDFASHMYDDASAEDARLDAQIAEARQSVAKIDDVDDPDVVTLAREAAQRCLAGADFSDLDVGHLSPTQRLWIACMNKQTARAMADISAPRLREHLSGRICLGTLPALMEVRMPVREARPQDYTPPRVHHLADGEEWTYAPRVPC